MKTESIRLTIEGMTCDHCATTIGTALSGVKGVKDAQVSFANKSAVVHVEPSVGAPDLVRAVEGAGRYRAHAEEPRPTQGGPRAGGGPEGSTPVILGGGSAAFAAAIRAADLGASATIVEAGTMGGTCVNVGCVPSKTLIRAAEKMHGANRNPFAGLSLSARVLDYAATVTQKDALVSALRQAKYAHLINSYPSLSHLPRT